MKGGLGWNLKILGVDHDEYYFYLMSLSRQIDISLKFWKQTPMFLSIEILNLLVKKTRNWK